MHYCAYLRARNEALLYAYARTDCVLVDSAPPHAEQGSVLDLLAGAMPSSPDINFQSETASVTMRWTLRPASADSGTPGFYDDVSGIERFEVGVGTRAVVGANLGPSGADVVPFEPFDHMSQVLVTHTLSAFAEVCQPGTPAVDRLCDGRTYYALVRAYDFAGGWVDVASDGVLVDGSAPEVGEVWIGPQVGDRIVAQWSTTQLAAHWCVRA